MRGVPFCDLKCYVACASERRCSSQVLLCVHESKTISSLMPISSNKVLLHAAAVGPTVDSVTQVHSVFQQSQAFWLPDRLQLHDATADGYGSCCAVRAHTELCRSE